MNGQFRIGRYLVNRRAFEPSDPDDLGTEGRISLFADADDDGPIKEALLLFRGSFVGDFPTGKAVRAILPRAEFEHWYRILQSEKPVFLEWETPTAGDTLSMLILSTGKEPLGEGVDRS